MNNELEFDTIEVPVNLEARDFEYIYVTIPAEYICVYHRILAMLADYGEEMLKDCKATCKDKNSGVIECFNMFNAAVAARTLAKGNDNSRYKKLADTLIKFIKAKINQIYKGKDNSTSFVFPVDETGQLKAFVSCGERPQFWINPADGKLYEHKFENGFDEHFRLGDEDNSPVEGNDAIPHYAPSPSGEYIGIDVTVNARYEKVGNAIVPCADVIVYYNGNVIDINKTDYRYYFDGVPVIRFNDVQTLSRGNHEFKVVVNYRGITGIGIVHVYYENTNS